MARLPDATALGGLPSARSGRAVVSTDTSAIERGGQALAAGIAQFGAGVEEWQGRRDNFEVAKAESEYLVRRERLRHEMSQETDPEVIGQKYPASFKSAASEAGAYISNPKAREFWLTKRAPDFEGDQITTEKTRHGLVASREVAGATERLQELRELALEADSEAERQQLIASAATLVDGLETAGYIDAETAQKQRRSWAVDYSAARISMLEPDEQVRVLKSNEGPAAFLQEEDRVAALDQAYAARESNRIQSDVSYARSIATGKPVKAMDLIREKEGFRSKPYWDDNAYRAGYGSDTYTTADGKVHKVTEDSVVSRADAERDLERRSREFEQTAISNVGKKAWDALPENARSALTSIAYNYGEIPSRIRDAVKSGNLEEIAQGILSLAGDNGGVNEARRKAEAAIVLAAGTERDIASGEIAEATALKVRSAAQTQLASLRTARKEELDLGIVNGTVTDANTILDDPLIDDGHKATLLRSFRTEEKRRADAKMVQNILAGDGVLNIYDADQRKGLDQVYKEAIETAPEGQQDEVAREIIERTGYVPDTLVRDVRSGLISQDDETLLRSVDMADKALEVNPAAFAGRDGDVGVGKAVEFFRSHRKLGYDDEQIVQKYRESLDPEFTVKRSALLKDKTTQDWIKETAVPGNVLDAFDAGLFDWEPEFVNEAQGLAITGEYRSLLEEALVETGGDRDAAKALAQGRLAKTYGSSELNLAGNEVLMRHPPERYYPMIGGSHDYVLKELREIVKDAEGLDVESVFLQSDGETEKDIKAGRLPRYQVWYTDENGKMQQLYGGHFVPDIERAGKESKVNLREQYERNAVTKQQSGMGLGFN